MTAKLGGVMADGQICRFEPAVNSNDSLGCSACFTDIRS